MRLALIAAFLFCAALPAAAQSRQQMLVDEKTGSVVEVISVFSSVPPTGYAPVRVKAINNMEADFAVTADIVSEAPNSRGNDHQLTSSFSLTASAGKTTEREFLVPICTAVEVGSSRAQLRVQLQASGRSDTLSFQTGGASHQPFTAFSDGLLGKTFKEFQDAVDGGSSHSYGRVSFAGLYSPGMLSTDWRAYSGLDVLAISSPEWTALAAGAKSAVLQWVKLGGTLNVYSKDGGTLEQLGIPSPGKLSIGPNYGGAAFALGNGRVCDLKWGGAALGAEEAKSYVKDNNQDYWPLVRRRQYAGSLSGRGSRGEPALVIALGQRDFAAWQVGLLLFIFGIVVGPVNLFYFARKGRRHRLFFTTPLISLAAALLLLLIIFFQDGTGGSGHRASLVYLDAGENAAFIHQTQVSRTGVLFGGGFELSDPAVVSMGVMPDSRWTRLKHRENDNYYYRSSSRSATEPQRYSVEDKRYAGDWFQSRSEQAQFIDAVQSTRGRIELKPGSQPPVITSTIAAPLERVCYTDAAGKHWASPGIVTAGAEVVLGAVSDRDFTAWRKSAVASLQEQLRERLEIHHDPGFFYASSSDPKAGMVETLDSIEWQSSAVFLYGPLK